MNDKCQFKNCNKPSCLDYLGFALCTKHWEKLSEKPTENMKKELKIKESNGRT